MPAPRFPIFIVSKSRSESGLTHIALDRLGLPYRVIVEGAQFDDYARFIDPDRLLVLDPAFQAEYDTFDDLGDTKSKGPGAARNFAWATALAEGAAWHWVMDDNIRVFGRLHQNQRIQVGDGTIFHAMETFCLRYRNVGMGGPHYAMFLPSRHRVPPFTVGSRIYSCNLIRNDLPLRWRGRYNEDTDLSIRMLKSGWATVLFNAFYQLKLPTQQIRGGNTDDFYAIEGTLPKSRMLVRMHPDVTRLTRRYGRWHHFVDYSAWRDMRLVREEDAEDAEDDAYRMRRSPRVLSPAVQKTLAAWEAKRGAKLDALDSGSDDARV